MYHVHTLYVHVYTLSEMYVHVYTFSEMYEQVCTIYVIGIYYSVVHRLYVHV